MELGNTLIAVLLFLGGGMFGSFMTLAFVGMSELGPGEHEKDEPCEPVPNPIWGLAAGLKAPEEFGVKEGGKGNTGRSEQ